MSHKYARISLLSFCKQIFMDNFVPISWLVRLEKFLQGNDKWNMRVLHSAFSLQTFLRPKTKSYCKYTNTHKYTNAHMNIQTRTCTHTHTLHQLLNTGLPRQAPRWIQGVHVVRPCTHVDGWNFGEAWFGQIGGRYVVEIGPIVGLQQPPTAVVRVRKCRQCSIDTHHLRFQILAAT